MEVSGQGEVTRLRCYRMYRSEKCSFLKIGLSVEKEEETFSKLVTKNHGDLAQLRLQKTKFMSQSFLRQRKLPKPENLSSLEERKLNKELTS